MERKEKIPGKMSVPQFGGWEQKPPGVPTDYSMVFNQARANKKNQKTDLDEVKRLNLGKERVPINANNRQSHGHGHHAKEDPPVLRRKKSMTYINCCIRP
ncbi:PREDICTED: uncharacterized protein LOC109329167 [Lupinus angustifolius]|uniref:uncharacterized protein LOC109329167 n=1 Tax=Lupinus angustifolius TaxID=3871 RepID=UPI00092F8C7A|nr:PREDICTED: uncharacterized protein LOC109329167 [Lupinus angustifolius]